jgi:hypothetical protein
MDQSHPDTSSDFEAQRSGAPSHDSPAPDTQARTTTSTTTSMTELPDTPDEALLRPAVDEYVAAFWNGDADAAASLLSPRCTGTKSMAEYRAAVAAGVSSPRPRCR